MEGGVGVHHHHVGLEISCCTYPHSLTGYSAIIELCVLGMTLHNVPHHIWYRLPLQPQAVDPMLKMCIGDFLKTLQDPDLNVRRVALVTFNSAAHNKPSLIRDMLESVLPHLYNETKVRVSVFMWRWPRLVGASLLVLSLVFTTKPFCCFHVHFYACFCVCLPDCFLVCFCACFSVHLHDCFYVCFCACLYVCPHDCFYVCFCASSRVCLYGCPRDCFLSVSMPVFTLTG